MSHTIRPHSASTKTAGVAARPSRGVSRLVAALTIGVATIALTACSEMTDAVDEALGEPTGSSGAPSGSDAAAQLAELTVAAEGPMTDYSREAFPHWSGQGDGCNTREVVLERDGTDVVTDDECRAQSGTWISVYDDEEFTDGGDLDIDHTVPLAAAWRSGAAEWDEERRQAFANDLEAPQLLAVSASSNRSKGDQTPADWVPPATAYHCTYASDWIAVKHSYELTVTEDEVTALEELLATC